MDNKKKEKEPIIFNDNATLAELQDMMKLNEETKEENKK